MVSSIPPDELTHRSKILFSLQRLSLEAESKCKDVVVPKYTYSGTLTRTHVVAVRIRGYVLSLEAHTQGAYAGIVEQHSPLSVASEGLVCQIASLRQSLQIAAIATDVNARPGRFLGCVLLLLQDSQLKVRLLSRLYATRCASLIISHYRFLTHDTRADWQVILPSSKCSVWSALVSWYASDCTMVDTVLTVALARLPPQ